MALNTRIRGQQINLSDEAIDITADSLAFKDTDGAIKVEAVDDFVTAIAGNGLANSASALIVDLNELSEDAIDVANDYIAFVDTGDNGSDKESIVDFVDAIAGNALATDSDGVLDVQVDDSGIEISGGNLQLKDDGVTVGKIAINNAEGAGVDGYVLTWNNSGSYMEWTSKTSITEDYLQESEIKLADESANCDGTNTTFTLDSSPVTNSVQVFLNGLLQQEGSGEDYTLTGTTVEFTTAPESGDILLIHYIAT